MDINEAALRLKSIEVFETQIKHLQNEARCSSSYEYAESCNDQAESLLTQLATLTNSIDAPKGS